LAGAVHGPRKKAGGVDRFSTALASSPAPPCHPGLDPGSIVARSCNTSTPTWIAGQARNDSLGATGFAHNAAMNANPSTSRTVLLAGGSGLVGREILKLLLADDSVAVVHSLGRRALKLEHAKLIQHTVDFAALPALPLVDEAFIALGTTIKVAGSQQAFRAVDYEAVVAVARAARTAGATRLGMVSAMGADPKSTLFYNRIKGETEQALKGMGFTTLVIARPSFLAGDREALGQPLRSGEKLALNISRKLAFLIPPNLKSIDVRKVARALVSGVSAGAKGTRVMLSGEMQTIKLM
jgi:uncharacterized protein YbjT (DUF2867 family)